MDPIKFLQPGYNYTIFQQLKNKIERMEDKEKDCALLYDEISIKKDLKYNTHIDEITGFLDYGDERRLLLGKQICVFMIRGLYHNYKYPLAYFVSDTSIKGGRLAKIVKDNITIPVKLDSKLNC